MKNKIMLLLMLLALAAGLCIGCSKKEEIINSEGNVDTVQGNVDATGNDGTQSVEEASETAVTPESTLEPEPMATPEPNATPIPEDDTWYDDMLEASLFSTGNNARLKNTIEKARNGEDVYIAAIGGSVTEGAGPSTMSKGYAYLFEQSFKEEFASGDGSNVHFVNAGLSGTPSPVGIMRYRQDIRGLLGADPDLLIIEFSVNDWQECTGGRAYESMIRQALKDNDDCAVVLLFAVFKNKWNLQDLYVPAGKFYELPMVSIKDAIVRPFKLGKIDDVLFFADDYHPTAYGHRIMRDCLMHLLKTVDAQEAEEKNEIPETSKKRLDFMENTLISADTEGVKLSLGGFNETDTAVQYLNFASRGGFPDNFAHTENSGSEKLTLKLTCKNLLLNYKTANNSKFGSAEFYVDGELAATYNGNDAGGWNNCNAVLLIDEAEASEHVVEVKMAEGDEDKCFTIYGFSFSK